MSGRRRRPIDWHARYVTLHAKHVALLGGFVEKVNAEMAANDKEVADRIQGLDDMREEMHAELSRRLALAEELTRAAGAMKDELYGARVRLAAWRLCGTRQ